MMATSSSDIFPQHVQGVSSGKHILWTVWSDVSNFSLIFERRCFNERKALDFVRMIAEQSTDFDNPGSVVWFSSENSQ